MQSHPEHLQPIFHPVGLDLRYLDLVQGAVLFRPGGTFGDLLILLKGCVALHGGNPADDASPLYQIRAGQAQGGPCLLRDDRPRLGAVAETGGVAVTIDRGQCRVQINRSPAFRRFLLDACQAHMRAGRSALWRAGGTGKCANAPDLSWAWGMEAGRC